MRSVSFQPINPKGMKMPSNQEMADKAMQDRVDDIDRQLAKLFSLHGLSWKHIERQRRDNEQAQGTKVPFNRKPHE